MMGSIISLLFLASKRGEIRRSTLNRGLKITAGASGLTLGFLCLSDGILSQMEVRSAIGFAGFGYTLLGLFFASVVGLCVIHAESRHWWAVLLRFTPLAYVGTISYMMYLIHMPVWVTLYQMLSFLEGHHAVPGLSLVLISMIVTIMIASLSWRYFEKPILRLKDSFPIAKQ